MEESMVGGEVNNKTGNATSGHAETIQTMALRKRYIKIKLFKRTTMCGIGLQSQNDHLSRK
jgi:hypothetical protein